MYQAHAHQLLNQKESEPGAFLPDGGHPLLAATRRLVAALDRLEGNLERVAVGREAQDPAVFERENEAMRSERDTLNHAISDLQHQYDGLHQAASAIYGKLDDSIKRLTHIIEH